MTSRKRQSPVPSPVSYDPPRARKKAGVRQNSPTIPKRIPLGPKENREFLTLKRVFTTKAEAKQLQRQLKREGFHHVRRRKVPAGEGVVKKYAVYARKRKSSQSRRSSRMSEHYQKVREHSGKAKAGDIYYDVTFQRRGQTKRVFLSPAEFRSLREEPPSTNFWTSQVPIKGVYKYITESELEKVLSSQRHRKNVLSENRHIKVTRDGYIQLTDSVLWSAWHGE